MSDLYPTTAAEGGSARRPWFRRRRAKVAVAGATVAALAVAGFGIGASASADVDPQQAVAQARENLRDLPTSITITGPADQPGTITVIRTDSGAQVSMDAPDKGAAFAVAMVDDQLYLRVKADRLDAVRANPFASGITAGFPSFGALLNGQWVSIDVSEDSEVLAALQQQAEGKFTDPAALRAAADDLKASMVTIGEDLREPLQSALESNVSVTKPAAQAAGPAGSTNYQVVLDAEAMASDLQPVLRDALNRALDAIDTFVADAGDQMPGAAAKWAEKRAEILAKFDDVVAKGSGQAVDPVDVWIADGKFTQIKVENLTMTFDSDVTLDAPAAATSMDEDLLRVLPLLANFTPGSLDPESLNLF